MWLMFAVAPLAMVGCDQDVAEIETPGGGEVEIEREAGTGALEAEVD